MAFIFSTTSLKASTVKSFSIYSILEGSNGPLTRSTHFITARAGRILLVGSGGVPELKLDENPYTRYQNFNTIIVIVQKINFRHKTWIAALCISKK